MNNEELEKMWRALDKRIERINERTKQHTLDIREIIKLLKDISKE